MLNTVLKNLTTFGFIGYLPAPGTWASLATIPLILALNNICSCLQPFIIVVLILTTYEIIKKVLPFFDSHDPSAIVIDEVVGMFVTFFMIPISFKSLVIGFCLFRFFDISKIGGSKFFERCEGAKGILLDDIWAGILSNIMLRIILRFIS